MTTTSADRQSRNASLALSLTLPVDVLLYLLLPMYADVFQVSIAEAGILLAANRLVRIVGYSWVVRVCASKGDRFTLSVAAIATVVCSLGYALLSGFWALLPLRMVWGLCFAVLNLSTQALATAEPIGAARRSGRSRAFIALGPVLTLPLGAVIAHQFGPRVVFLLLALIALCALMFTRPLSPASHAPLQPSRRWKLPNALDTWSFLEGLTLDGLFIIGLAYLGKDLMPHDAVLAAGLLMALRYLSEILLGPLGGRMADSFGAERLLVVLSLMTCVALVGFGAGWVWSGAAFIVVLRALQLPLLAPIVARRVPGPGRIQALAARSIWRDIGAGTGPVIAGLLLPIMPSVWIYGVAALLLAWAAIACGRSPHPEPQPGI